MWFFHGTGFVDPDITIRNEFRKLHLMCWYPKKDYRKKFLENKTLPTITKSKFTAYRVERRIKGHFTTLREAQDYHDRYTGTKELDSESEASTYISGVHK